MAGCREMSSQIYTVEYDRSHQRNKNETLKVFKRGMRLHPVWGGTKRGRKENHPERFHKIAQYLESVWRMDMFSKGEDKDWEMRTVLMDWGMDGGRTAGCIRKQQVEWQMLSSFLWKVLFPFYDLSQWENWITSESTLLERHYTIRDTCMMIWQLKTMHPAIMLGENELFSKEEKVWYPGWYMD